MRYTGQFIFILIFLIALGSNAQTCCSGGVPISTNLGLPPSFAGTVQFTLTYDVNVLRTLKEGTNTLDDRARERITRSVILSAGYAVTDRFSFEALVPWVRQERDVQQVGGLNDFESTQGIGDLLILFKYRVTSVSNQRHMLSVGVGPKMPTGSAREVNGRGLILNADLQPGSGAWDGIFWTNYFYHMSNRPTMSIYSVLTYRLAGTNENYLNNTSTYKIGNNFRALVGVSDQLKMGSTMVNPNLGIRYRKAREDQFNGDPVASTGGEWAFLVPGIGVSILPNLTFETNFELPIYANPSGTQLTPTYRVNVGLYYVIAKKNKGIKNFID